MRQTRQRILSGAVQALKHDPGASLEGIAEAAGVGRATVYRHFGSRSELLAELGNGAVEALESAVVEIEERGLRGLEALLALLADDPDPDWASFAANFGWSDFGTGARERYDKVIEVLVGWVEAAQHVGEIPRHLPASWVVRYHVAITFAAWEGVADGDLARNDVPQLLTETFLSGVGVS